MKECTYRLSLSELLNRPMGLVALRGSDGEPSDSDGGDPKGGDDGDKSKTPSGDDGDKPKEKPAEQTPEAKRIAALEEEKQRFYDQREEAKSEVKTLKAEIAQLKKDGTPDDALKKSNDELTSTNAKLAEANQKLMLQNAFLTEKGFDWVDPDAALRLADLSGVEFDEKTNRAVGLNSALTKLAKDKPYLLKKTEKDDEGDPKPSPRGTGKPPAPGSQKAADKAARDAELRRKYPALRR